MRRHVRSFADMGYGGFFLHARMGRITPYLSEAWFRAIGAAVDEARACGLDAWFYDEDNWPSGYAGGKVLEMGDWTRQQYARVRILSVQEYGEVGDGIDEGVLAVYEAASGGPYRCLIHASPQDGTLHSLPALSNEAQSVLLLTLELHRELREFCPEEHVSGYVDVFNPRVTDAFLEVTYEAYRSRFAEYIGSTLKGSFFDEPEFHEAGLWGDGPTRLPWTGALPDEYSRRSGRNIFSDIPSLLRQTSDTPQTRYWYYRTLTELFSENFTGRIRNWCRNHGLELTGHVILEEHPSMAVRSVGNPFAHYRHSDIPGIDHLGRPIELQAFWSSSVVLCKQPQSASAQLGRDRVLCELFAGATNAFYPVDQKHQMDWMAALGVNMFCYHAAHYSLRGYRKRDYPPTLGGQQPWAPWASLLSDHAACIGDWLNRGRRIAEIAVIHPIESIWATQSADDIVREDDILNTSLRPLAEALVASGWDWDFVDEAYLQDLGETEGDRLIVGECSYRYVLVPPAVTLRSSTWAILENFITAGGRIAGFEIFPAFSEGRESVAAGRRTDWEDWGPVHAEGFTELLQHSLSAWRAPQLRREGSHNLGDLVFQERRDGEQTILFIATSRREAHRETLHCRIGGTPMKLDTVTGRITPLPCRRVGEETTLELDFAPGQSHLIVFEPDEPATPPLRSSGSRHLAIAGERDDCSLMIRRESPNALILDRGILAAQEQEYPFMQAQEATVRLKTLPESTHFTWTVRFFSDIELDAAYLLLENPEAYRAEFNGRVVPPEDGGYFLETSLRRLALPSGVKKGENTLVLRGTFRSEAELEPMFILGDFAVRLEGDAPTMDVENQRIRIGSVTSQGYPFYAGVLRYRIPFTTDHPAGKARLRLSDENRCPMEFIIDGESAGSCAWPPYTAEFPELSAGPHVLEVRVASHLRNFYGPHHVVDEDSIDCFNPMNHFGEENGLCPEYRTKPVGLFGKVVLELQTSLEEGSSAI